MNALRISLFALASVLIAGCSEPASGEVSGTVTFDGQPIEQGSISFTPVDGNGPTAGGAIIGGKYTAPKVPVGASKVTISGAKETEKKRMYDDPKAPLVQTSVEMLPAKYSDVKATTLEYQVVAGNQTKDFTLVK